MEELIQSLKSLLSNAVILKYRAQGAHWNVEGPDFSQYHSLYSSIYDDVDSCIDPIAENIRKLGDYAPFSLTRFISLGTITESPFVSSTPAALTADLLSANEIMLINLYDAFAKANAANSQGIANFLAERIDMHEKWAWQLKASSKSV